MSENLSQESLRQLAARWSHSLDTGRCLWIDFDCNFSSHQDPYIPENLNRILMHFSKSANVFYDDTLQLLDDLYEFKSGFSKREISDEPRSESKPFDRC